MQVIETIFNGIVNLINGVIGTVSAAFNQAADLSSNLFGNA